MKTPTLSAVSITATGAALRAGRWLAALLLLSLESWSASAAEPEPFRVVERGPHHTLQEFVRSETDAHGSAISVTNRFTEIASGLNHWDGTDWQPTEEAFRLEEGFATAWNGQHKVTLPANLNEAGAVQLRLPDGRLLRSHIYGLAYFDAGSGQSVLLGQLQDSQGWLTAPNELTFENAFTNVLADVRYTYRRGGFSQDIIVREQLPPPETFGFSSASTRLEVWTEFVETPEPAKVRPGSDQPLTQAEAEDLKQDEQLDFTSMQIGTGRTFSVDQSDASLALVVKRWLAVAGRRFLVETVPLPEVAAKLEQLPPGSSGGAWLKLPVRPRLEALRNAPVPRQAETASRSRFRPQSLAVLAAVKRPGLVLDYEAAVSAANFTFLTGKTYYVSGAVIFTGTSTTFEPAVTIKYAPTNSAKLVVNTPVTWLGEPYRPVVLTARDDHTIGEKIGTNALGGGYYALTALEFNTTGALTVTNVRVSKAQNGIVINNATGPLIRHAQFYGCSVAVKPTGTSLKLQNALLSQNNTAIQGTSSTVYGEHVTVGQASTVNGGGTVYLTNSLTWGVSGTNSLQGSSFDTISGSPSGVFQTTGAGAYYLAGSTYRNTGTTTINAELKEDLKRLTTYAPTVRTDTVSVDTSLPRTATRNTDTPDRGYHYLPIDYAMANFGVTNATLTLAGSPVVASFGTANGTLCLFGSSALCAEGTPNEPIRFPRYNVVQEQPAEWSGAMSPSLITLYPRTTGSVGARFCQFYGEQVPQPLYHTYQDASQWSVRHLLVRDSFFFGQAVSISGANPPLVESADIVNNVFLNTQIFSTLDSGQDFVLRFYNNHVQGGYLLLDTHASNHFILRDNVFLATEIEVIASPETRGYNAFIATTSNMDAGTGDLTLSSFPFVSATTGAFVGNLYQGASNFINTGSRTATDAGLAYHTTTTGQANDTGTVDIGFHYVALNPSGGAVGQPKDGDSDGNPDYKENNSGNCFCDGTLPSFSVALTKPTASQVFALSPTNVVFQASTSGTVSAIDQVEYLWNGTSLGFSPGPTNDWMFTWESVPSGTKSGLTARAWDCDCNVPVTSASRSITVNAMPGITWVTPTGTTTNGSVAPGAITLHVTVTDSDGTISKVEFFNGLSGTPIATLTSSNTGTNGYTYSWTSVAAGRYPIYAKATDNRGAERWSDTRLFVVNPANPVPQISITSPANGTVLKAFSSLTIAATATDTNGVAGAVSLVEFYADDISVGSDATGVASTFHTTLAGLKPGTYKLTAKAADNGSPTSRLTSQPVTITVAEPEPVKVNGFWDPVFGNFEKFGTTCAQFGSALQFDSAGDLYFGGYGCNSGGATKVLKHSSCAWSQAFASSPNSGSVNAILSFGTNLYFGGAAFGLGFSDAHYICRREGTSYVEIGDGLEWEGDPLCVPGAEDGFGVQALHVLNGDLIIGGDFTGVGTLTTLNTNIQYLAKLAGTATNWSAVTSGKLNGRVRAIADLDNTLYVGGYFTSAGGNTNIKYLAKLVNGQWQAVGSGINGPVLALTTHNDRLFVGGEFTTAGGLTNAIAVASWDGLRWTSINNGVSEGTQDSPGYDCSPTNRVSAIAARGNEIYVTGDFTKAWNGSSPVVANHVARATWNEENQSWEWSALGEGLRYDNGDPADEVQANGRALAIRNLSNGTGYEVIVAGFFTHAGGLRANHVARWVSGQSDCPVTGPTVQITAPTDGSKISGSSYTFTATATPIGGTTIDKVDFFLNGAFVGTGTLSGSWSLFHTGLQAGPYTLKAVAADSDGNHAASAPVKFAVTAASGPNVTNETFIAFSPGTATNLNVLANDTGTGPLRVVSATKWANPLGSSAAGSVKVGHQGAHLVFQPQPYTFGLSVISYDVADNNGTNTGFASVHVKSLPQVTVTPPPADGFIYSNSAPSNIPITGKARDYDGSITNVALYVNGLQYGATTTSTNFSINWSTNAAGFYTLVVLAHDNEGYTNASAPITVSYNPPGGDNLVADITNLSNPSETNTTLVSFSYPVIRDGFFDLYGQVYDSDLGNWRDPSIVSYAVFVYSPNDSETPVANVTPGTLNYQGFKAGGDSGGSLGTLNLTALPNGVYDLMLVARSQGQGATNQVRVSLVNDLKLGAFTFTEQDVVIPVNGIPLTVVRKYDSLNLTAADYGWCWTMSVNDVDATLDEERTPKEVLAFNGMDGNDGSYTEFSLRTGGGRNVMLTLPDGRRVNFLFNPRISFDPEKPVAWAEWQSPPGVTATLTLKDVPLGASDVNQANTINFHANGWGKPVWSNGDARTPFDAYDLPGYDLHFKDGTVFELRRDPAFGSGEYVTYDANGEGLLVPVKPYQPQLKLAAIRQKSLDRIEITDGGITHKKPSGGITRSVWFERDEKNRVAAIRDPLGQNGSSPSGPDLVRYLYNEDTGNLVQVHRLVDRTGTGTYVTNRYYYNHSRFPHYITSIENARGIPITRNEYDDYGRLVAMIDPAGKTNRFVHDTANKVEQVVDPLSRTVAMGYDTRGNILAVTNALGTSVQQVSRYTYDDVGNRLTETDPLGRVTAYGYDASNLPLAVTNALGNSLQQIIRYTYNAEGLPTVTTDPLGYAITNSYNGLGLLVNLGNADGLVLTNFYDGDSRLASSVSVGSLVATNTYDGTTGNLTNVLTGYYSGGSFVAVGTNTIGYDANGRQVAVTNGLGLITRYGYDALGRVVAVTNAFGTASQTITTTEYEASGQVSKTVDARGVTTAFGYDDFGRRVAVTNALGTADQTVTTTEYDVAGQVTKTVDLRGMVTAIGYNELGRRIAVTNALGTSLQQIARYAYDANGNLTNVVDALGRATDQQYDALNRQTAVLPPLAISGGNRTGSTNVYDLLGRRIAAVDQAGKSTGFGYDALGRLTSVTNALGKITRYGYDTAGRLTAETNALSRVTTYAFNSLGARSKRTVPGGAWEGFAYDTLGRPMAHTNFAGTIITNQYDSLGRLWKRWQAGTTLETSLYSAFGQLTNRVDASGTHVWVHDAFGRLKTNTTPVGTLHYTYDATSLLLTLGSTTTSGVTNQFQYDALGRLTNVVDLRLTTANKNTAYGYDGVGNLEWMNLRPNGVTSWHRYDAQNRLTNLVWALNGSLRAGFGYTLGAAGNRLTLAETNNGTSRSFTWGYDNTYRLQSEALSGGSPTGTLSYTYDDTGNRLTRNAALGLGSQAFNFDVRDQLDNDATPTSLSTYFDANGSTTSYGGTWQYDWANRLTNYNTGAVVLTYDAAGNRTKKVAGGTTTHFLVATVNPTGWPQVVEEHTGTSPGTVSRRYTYGLDLISQWQSAGSATHFYATDGLGNVRTLLNTSGTITDTYTYDAYGNLIASSGTTANRYLFAGEQWDSDLSLYYNRARYLNPALGRFQTMDTFEGGQSDPLSLHKYLYASDDPVNRIDPSGNESLLSISATMGIMGFANRLELQGANASLQKARALFGADDSVNSLINGLEIASIVDDKIGQVALGGAALYGGFKVVNALRNFVSSGTASRVGQAILRNLQKMVGSSAAACFTAGTLIETEYGKVPIEQVQTGDYVWSWSEETEAFTLQRVTSTMERTSDAVIDLQIDGDIITVTPEHPFQVTGRGWIAAKDLPIGETVASEAGVSLLVESKAFRHENVQVFNFEVEYTHTYLVGPDGVVVHNACAWATRKASLPSAPGIYILKTKTGDTYVGRASNLKDRLSGEYKFDPINHEHLELFQNAENELYTLELDAAHLNGASPDSALRVAEEFYKRALGTRGPGGMNGSVEISPQAMEAYIQKFNFPPFGAPTPH